MTTLWLNSRTDEGGTVVYGDFAGLEDQYGDCTIGCLVSIQNIEDRRVLAIPGIRLDCVSGSTGWYPRAGVTTVLGDEVTVTDPTERDLITPLDLRATYDATTGELTLYVDGTSVASDSVEEPAERANAGKYMYSELPAASRITNIAAWSSVLAPSGGSTGPAVYADAVALYRIENYTGSVGSDDVPNEGTDATASDMALFNSPTLVNNGDKTSHLVFDGANDLARLSPGPTPSSVLTVVVVVDATFPASLSDYVLGVPTGGNAGGFDIQAHTLAGAWRSRMGTAGPVDNTNDLGGTLTVVTMRQNGASGSDRHLRVNGVNGTPGPNQAFTATPWFIMCRDSGGLKDYCAGKLYTLAIWDRVLSDAEVAEIETYHGV